MTGEAFRQKVEQVTRVEIMNFLNMDSWQDVIRFAKKARRESDNKTYFYGTLQKDELKNNAVIAAAIANEVSGNFSK